MESEREELAQRVSDWLDLPMAILALAWAILIAVELAANLPPEWSDRVRTLDIFIWLLFLVEFAFELAIAPRKPEYLRTHWITAVSVLLPFLGSLRLVGALALLRTLSLARVVVVANRATRAAGQILAESRFGYVLAVVALAVLLGSTATYFFERTEPRSPLANYGEALWWAATLVTTINTSADPVTLEGRIVAVLLRVLGLAIFGYITASIASYFVGERESAIGRATEEERDELLVLLAEVRALRRALEGTDEAEPPPPASAA